MTPKECGCPPHVDDSAAAPRRIEIDAENVVVAYETQCGRCGKTTTAKQPYDPDRHGPRVGATNLESYDEYAHRTRDAYAAEAVRIRNELVNLVSDAMITRDPGSVAAGADIDGLAEIAVEAVAEFFANQKQPFVNAAASR